jgi:hypothetical protein
VVENHSVPQESAKQAYHKAKPFFPIVIQHPSVHTGEREVFKEPRSVFYREGKVNLELKSNKLMTGTRGDFVFVFAGENVRRD